MKKTIQKSIKGILLGIVFMFTFGVNLPALTNVFSTYEKAPVTQESSILYVSAQADLTVDEKLAAMESLDDMEAAAQEAANPDSFVAKVADSARYLHKIFYPLINFFATQIGNFLGTDYIFYGPMGEMLKNIWVVSRNLVNILFVLILLGLALKEIFDVRSGEGSKLKDNLVKFTLILVAVNFSWLASKVVLDAANVATQVVFSIPMGVAQTGVQDNYEPCNITNTMDFSTQKEGQCMPSAAFTPIDGDTSDIINRRAGASVGGDADECNIEEIEGLYKEAYPESGPEVINDVHGKTTICWDNINLVKYTKNTSVVYLTYGMARIQDLPKATTGSCSEGTLGCIGQLAVGTFLSMIIQLGYTLALFALFVAMIARMILLWVFVGFSPFLILMLYSEKFSKVAEGKFTLAQFIKWAFIPAQVGLVFSVAFLMVSAGQAFTEKNPTYFDKLSQGGGEMTVKAYKVQSLFMGMDSLSQFIWLLIVLIVLWMGVFSVLKDMPIANIVTEKVNDLGKRAGTWLGKTPYWAPIMPQYDPITGKIGRTSPEKVLMAVPNQLKEAEYAARGKPEVSDYDKVNANVKAIKTDPGKQAKLTGLAKGGSASAIAAEYGVSPETLYAMKDPGVFGRSGIADEKTASKLWEIIEKDAKGRSGATKALEKASEKIGDAADKLPPPAAPTSSPPPAAPTTP